MKTTTAANHINVTFNVTFKGNDQVLAMNDIWEIASKHNAQTNVYQNTSPWKYNRRGDLIGEQWGNAGGTITFHSHSCDHLIAAKELIDYLEVSCGLTNEQWIEVTRTHRADGTAYKCPQTFIEMA